MCPPASLCPHTSSRLDAGDTGLSLLPGETIKGKALTITQPSDSMIKGDTRAHMPKIATVNLASFYIFLQLQQMSLCLPGGTLGTLQPSQLRQSCLEELTALAPAPRGSLLTGRLIEASRIVPALKGTCLPERWLGFGSQVSAGSRSPRPNCKLGT